MTYFYRLRNGLLTFGVAVVISACGGGGGSPGEDPETTAANFNNAEKADEDAFAGDTLCSVTAATLASAHDTFVHQCGFAPTDCDPQGSAWLCSSETIGNAAPVRPTTTTPVPGVSGEQILHELNNRQACYASAASLTDARQAYFGVCSQPMVDCDEADGQWYCASVQMGSASPDSPVFPNADNADSTMLLNMIRAASDGTGLRFFTLPESDDYDQIPQDPLNRVTGEKVALGKLLYHDTGFALDGVSEAEPGWSCASCHHAEAGFKAGIPQGIGEGGIGFGFRGTQRLLDHAFDGNAPAGAVNKPDVQPIASPTILNSAYQSVMLWNGQFGNSAGGVNATVSLDRLATPDTPKAQNNRELAGLETQAIAGTIVHRLNFSDNTPLQNNGHYQQMWESAFPAGSSDVAEDAGKAIAAYERTVLANRAPFQKFLRGDTGALDSQQLRGGVLFFGKAGCVECHRGPALSSAAGASEDEMFFALGFDDLDPRHTQVHGSVDDATKKGRGGFSGESDANFQFKIPQLYNLVDADVLGHGASFLSVREVVDYKNRGVAQNNAARGNLDSRFVPLGLTAREVSDLVAFLEHALHDPDLARYQPDWLPGSGCLIVDDLCD